MGAGGNFCAPQQLSLGPSSSRSKRSVTSATCFLIRILSNLGIAGVVARDSGEIAKETLGAAKQPLGRLVQTQAGISKEFRPG
jgi:hypothetical protein